MNGIYRKNGRKISHKLQQSLGLWIYAAYGINQYKLRFLGERNYSKHKLQNVRTGIGIRISPLRSLYDEYDWCPIIELGTKYVKNFSYKGPYGNDADQINDGMRTFYGIGAEIEDFGRVMLNFEMAHYNLFNRSYTPDGGFWYPYANFKNKDYSISLSIAWDVDY